MGRHPLLIGMLHDLIEIIRLQRVKDIEEVLARRTLASWICIREVLHEICIFLEMRPQRLDRQFVVVWNIYLLDFGLLHQLLLANENVLEEVLVDDVGIREIVLDCI